MSKRTPPDASGRIVSPVASALSAVMFLGLAACGVQGPSLAGEPGLQTKVLAYYRDHATEEGGTCRAPRIRGITRTNVIEDTGMRLVVGVRYNYVDDFFEDDEILRVPERCTGFSERSFTMRREPGGNLIVDDMSGPRRTTRDFRETLSSQ